MTETVLHINGRSFSIPSDRTGVVTDDPFVMEVMRLVNDWFTHDQFELFSSGSTGAPKPFLLAKAAIEKSAQGTANFFKLPQGTTALCCLPLNKIAGRMMLYRSLVNGWELTVQHAESNPLKEEQAFDFVALTPFQAHTILDENPSAFNAIKKVILGGAKVHEGLKTALQAFRCEVWETYGMTETITHIAAKQISPKPQNEFHCLPGIHIRATPSDQLCISSNYIDEIITNDIVKLTSSSTFELLGRKDFVINSGGIKLFPEQIESKLAGFLSERFYISKSAHASLGEQVILVIESSPFEEQAQVALMATLRTVLSKYELPKSIVFRPKFEETDTGKIIRQTV